MGESELNDKESTEHMESAPKQTNENDKSTATESISQQQKPPTEENIAPNPSEVLTPDADQATQPEQEAHNQGNTEPNPSEVLTPDTDQAAQPEQEAPKSLAERIFEAAENGDAGQVKQCLDDGFEIESKNEDGETPLHTAARLGHEDAVKILLERGANVNTKDTENNTPLTDAADDGHTNIVDILLNHNAEVDAQDDDGWTALMYAVRDKRADMIKVLLSHHADPNKRCGLWTPLTKACQSSVEDGIIQILLDAGGDINVRDNDGWTPLAVACYYSTADTVTMLLDRGVADVNVQNNDGWTPLAQACESASPEKVKILLAKNANIHTQDNEAWTPFAVACSRTSVEVVRILLEKGADISSSDKYGWTPLARACESENIEIMNILLEKGAEIHVKDSDGWAPFAVACSKTSADAVRILLKKGADISARDNYGWTPLARACTSTSPEIVNILLDKGVDISARDNYGWTPLARACTSTSPEIVKILLDKGVDINVKDNDGWTPLARACESSNIDIVNVLLEKGADIHVKDNDGWTPLAMATSKTSPEIIRVLIEKGADVNVQDNYGWAPLSRAADSSNIEIVNILIEKGADVNVKDKNGWTPLSRAANSSSPNLEMVNTLLEKGADVNSQHTDGWSPLALACWKKSEDIVRVLLDKGANINVHHDDGSTPLSIAAEAGISGTVKMLLEKGANIDAQMKNGRTALLQACWKNFADTIRVLLDKGAAIDIQDDEGWTPLQFVVRYADRSMVELLLSKGANVDIVDNDGWAPLHKAHLCDTVADRGAIARLLLEHHAKIPSTTVEKQTPLYMASESGCKEVVEVLLEYDKNVDAPDAKGWTALQIASSQGHGSVVKLLLDKGAAPNMETTDTHQTPLALAILSLNNLSDATKQEDCKSAISHLAKKTSTSDKKFALSKAATEKATTETNLDVVSEIMRQNQLGPSDVDEAKQIWCAVRPNERHRLCQLLLTGKAEPPSDEEKPSTPLQWAAYYGNHVVVWWLLKTTLPSQQTDGDRDRETAQRIAERRRDEIKNVRPSSAKQDGAVNTDGKHDTHGRRQVTDSSRVKGDPSRENQTSKLKEDEINYALTADMLRDPPPVTGASDDQPYELPSIDEAQQNVVETWYATIVDFYRSNGRVDLLRRSRNVWTVIYDEETGGPEKLMDSARTTLQKISPEAAREKEYSKNDLKMRWIHLPANNMTWIEDLVKRICIDKKWPKEEYFKLRDLIQGSWQELPTGTSKTKFMKPGCVKSVQQSHFSVEEGTQTSPDGSKQGTTNPNPNLTTDTIQDGDKESQAQGPKGQDTQDGHTAVVDAPKEPRLKQKVAGKDETDGFERVALYMPYITFGKCFRPDEHSGSREQNRNSENKGQKTRSDDDIRTKCEQLITTYDKAMIHSSRSLDLFYYQSLSDISKRNADQVVTRFLTHGKNGKELENEEWWPILIVDQLWLWVIDEETILTCSTHRPDGLEDPVTERIFNYLREAKGNIRGQPPPSSAKEMAKFIVSFCISFLTTATWNSSTTGKFDNEKYTKAINTELCLKSAHEIFADTVNQKAAEEKSLFTNFTNKVNRRQQESKEKALKALNKPAISLRTTLSRYFLETVMGLRNPSGGQTHNSERDAAKLSSSEDTDDDDEDPTQEEHEDWDSICKAAKLLDEVKDIRDELNILKTVLQQQGNVWELLLKDSPSNTEARTEAGKDPMETLREIDQMDNIADGIQTSVKDILGLEQNGISITEALLSRGQAEESFRQGRTIMVFTVVTILFLPLSFLTSLFAINVSSFQHDNQGNLKYEPGVIFPLIFCISFGVAAIIIFFAFYVEDAMKIWKELMEIHKHRKAIKHQGNGSSNSHEFVSNVQFSESHPDIAKSASVSINEKFPNSEHDRRRLRLRWLRPNSGKQAPLDAGYNA